MLTSRCFAQEFGHAGERHRSRVRNCAKLHVAVQEVLREAISWAAPRSATTLMPKGVKDSSSCSIGSTGVRASHVWCAGRLSNGLSSQVAAVIIVRTARSERNRVTNRGTLHERLFDWSRSRRNQPAHRRRRQRRQTAGEADHRNGSPARPRFRHQRDVRCHSVADGQSIAARPTGRHRHRRARIHRHGHRDDHALAESSRLDELPGARRNRAQTGRQR